MPILALIHFLVLLFIFRSKMGWRSASVWAALVGGVELVAVTEIFSLFHGLRFGILAGVWTALTLVWIGVAAKQKTFVGARKFFNFAMVRSDLEQAMLAGMAGIVLLSLVVAIVAPPNNWDSLTYHMARVAQWAHHQSVANYPTNILRQLHQNPFAEFVILHLYVLAGGDAYANLVQWGAWVAAILAASLLAKELGAGRRGQIWSAVLVATMPMAVLQATNTQNDLVLGALLLAMALFFLRIIRADAMAKLPWADFLGGAAALGLAVLTKGTSYVFAAPWIAAMVAVAFYRWRARALGPMVLIATIVIALNAGHWSRNYKTYGSILGAKVEHGLLHDYYYANDSFGPATFTSNVLRNLALHAINPVVSAERVEGTVRWIHAKLGLDADDPRSTWAGETFTLNNEGWNNLERAGNPVHLLLAVIGAGAVLRRPRWNPAMLMSSLVAGGFVLFCAYLRWQPWHSRLHLPLFLLMAAPLGVMLQHLNHRVLSWCLLGVLFVGAGWRAIDSRLHPLFGEQSIFTLSREEQYVATNPPLLDPMKTFASVMEGRPASVGLICGINEPEYLLWVFGRLECVKHIHIHNVSMNLPADSCQPQLNYVLKVEEGRLGFPPPPTSQPAR